MAFFCYTTGEIASHFENGSETKVNTDANLCSYTFTDALSAYTGKPEHWQWKDEDKMSAVELQALGQLQSALQSGRSMIRVPALASDVSLKNPNIEGLPPATVKS